MYFLTTSPSGRARHLVRRLRYISLLVLDSDSDSCRPRRSSRTFFCMVALRFAIALGLFCAVVQVSVAGSVVGVALVLLRADPLSALGRRRILSFSFSFLSFLFSTLKRCTPSDCFERRCFKKSCRCRANDLSSATHSSRWDCMVVNSPPRHHQRAAELLVRSRLLDRSAGQQLSLSQLERPGGDRYAAPCKLSRSLRVVEMLVTRVPLPSSGPPSTGSAVRTRTDAF
jgi:hypothetical protein